MMEEDRLRLSDVIRSIQKILRDMDALVAEAPTPEDARKLRRQRGWLHDSFKNLHDLLNDRGNFSAKRPSEPISIEEWFSRIMAKKADIERTDEN